MYLVTSPGPGFMGMEMLAHFPFCSQPPYCILLDTAPGAQDPCISHPSKIPFQAQPWLVRALYLIAETQGAGLTHCKRWVLLCWNGGPYPAPLAFHLSPVSLPPQSLFLGFAMKRVVKATGIMMHVHLYVSLCLGGAEHMKQALVPCCWGSGSGAKGR